MVCTYPSFLIYHELKKSQAILDLSSASSSHSRGSSFREFYFTHINRLCIADDIYLLILSSTYLEHSRPDLGLCFPQKEYASEVARRLTDHELWADVDNGENTLPKKIRNGEIAQYNFIIGQYSPRSLGDIFSG